MLDVLVCMIPCVISVHGPDPDDGCCWVSQEVRFRLKLEGLEIIRLWALGPSSEEEIQVERNQHTILIN